MELFLQGDLVTCGMLATNCLRSYLNSAFCHAEVAGGSAAAAAAKDPSSKNTAVVDDEVNDRSTKSHSATDA